MARIAINTRYLFKGKLEGFGWYSYEISRRLVEQHPEHEFYFFFDRKFDQEFIFSQNVRGIVLNPPARHPILWRIWYDFSVKIALKKYKIDVFFSPDGFVSLNTNVKQICTIHDLNFEHYPKDVPSHIYKFLHIYFPLFINKADKVLTISNFSKSDIIKQYGVPSEKIQVIWNGTSAVFQVKSSELIQTYRNTFSQGKPYFIFVGSLNPRKNVNRMLEAFFQYAEDKNNDWNLVIVGEAMWKNQMQIIQIPEDLTSRITFTGRLSQNELVNVTASAGAMVFVSYFEGFGLPLVEAMKCGVPILAADASSLPEIAADAAIYCDPFSVDEIKNGMIEISKNSELQNQLIQNGFERGKLFDWDKTAQQVWLEIEKLINADSKVKS